MSGIHFTRLAVGVLAALSIITPAIAQEQAPPSMFMSLLPLIVIFAIFYVLLIRPQQKRLKEHKQLVIDLKKGDKVLTAGGVVGKITSADEEFVKVEIAEGVRVKIKRDTILNKVD